MCPETKAKAQMGLKVRTPLLCQSYSTEIKNKKTKKTKKMAKSNIAYEH